MEKPARSLTDEGVKRFEASVTSGIARLSEFGIRFGPEPAVLRGHANLVDHLFATLKDRLDEEELPEELLGDLLDWCGFRGIDFEDALKLARKLRAEVPRSKTDSGSDRT